MPTRQGSREGRPSFPHARDTFRQRDTGSRVNRVLPLHRGPRGEGPEGQRDWLKTHSFLEVSQDDLDQMFRLESICSLSLQSPGCQCLFSAQRAGPASPGGRKGSMHPWMLGPHQNPGEGRPPSHALCPPQHMGRPLPVVPSGESARHR